MVPEWLSFALTVINGLAVVYFGVCWIRKMKECGRLVEENTDLRVQLMKAGCERSQVKAAIQKQFPPPPQAEVDLDEAWMDAATKKILIADPKTILTGTVKVNVQDGTYEINYDQDGTSERGRIGDLVGPSDLDRDHG